MFGRITAIPRYVFTHGLGGFARELKHRFTERLVETFFRVETQACLSSTELGFVDNEYNGYQAIPYAALATAMKALPLRASEVSFLDIGCGKGRPMIVAAVCGCRTLRGVDLAPNLVAAAQRNLARYSAQVEPADATTYAIPTDVNVVFLANSVSGEALAKVAQNIRDSYARAPRPLYLLYFNADWFERFLAGAVPGFNKRWWGRYYPGDFLWAIYEVT